MTMKQLLEGWLHRARRWMAGIGVRCVDCGGVTRRDQKSYAEGLRSLWQKGIPPHHRCFDCWGKALASRRQKGLPPHYQRGFECWSKIIHRAIDDEGTVRD